MKQMGSLLPILLLLGVGITSGLAAGSMTADQYVVPNSAMIGENVNVVLNLMYYGENDSQISVTPLQTPGVQVIGGASVPAWLSPGQSYTISYPVMAVESGYLDVETQIAYTESGIWQSPLNMISSFSAIGVPPQPQPQTEPEPLPEPQPGGEEDQDNPPLPPPGDMPPG